jgi:polyribonucleotide nucleotidyltransferase
MPQHTVQTTINGLAFSIETGRLAKQAGGAAVARMGDTMVLATACSSKPREDVDFFPLSVEYIAKTYAAGKIPGGFFKREGKPSEKEILSARLVDRPVRPLFPDGYNCEVQIVATVISADETYDADVLAITAASAALSLSQMPFLGPIAGVRIGMVDGKLKVFPTLAETEAGMLDLVVAGSEDSIVMVEGGACEVSEEVLVEALNLAHEEIKKLVAIQKELLAKVGTQKPAFESPARDEALYAAVNGAIANRLHEISFLGDKTKRYSGVDALLTDVKTKLAEQFPEREKDIAAAFHEIERTEMRQSIVNTGTRIGGRDLDTIRNITCELDILPRAHGSALFTRGETQSMVVTTLGTKLDEQRIDNIQGEYSKSYMLHYNFPPYSVGEVKRMGSVGRREIGHGHLAERSLAPVLPNEKSFAYTIRVVSEILESNGSSSMASVCGGSLSLMAAGVPIKGHVAGVAMGLIKEGGKIAILTDILGTEDHLGDMDFKVAGTREGITAVQMDIKIHGITSDVMKNALEKARVARQKILDIMTAALPKSRREVSEFAPRIFTMKIDKDKIRELIGPGGKVVREIQETTQSTINIEDDGTVNIYAMNKEQKDAAVLRVKAIACDPEIGEVFEGKVKTVTDFGAFVEFLPGKDGLVHISELDLKRVEKTEDIAKVGDMMKVKVIGFDRFGKIKLSRKALL